MASRRSFIVSAAVVMCVIVGVLALVLSVRGDPDTVTLRFSGICENPMIVHDGTHWYSSEVAPRDWIKADSFDGLFEIDGSSGAFIGQDGYTISFERSDSGFWDMTCKISN